uniref:Protein kinase domain-containing protein n=1 Tax=Arcella intermedia TaxID=1963864 RepID=A0A6B2L6E5_9EUKA
MIYKGKVAGIPKTVVIKDMDIRDAKSIEDWRKEVSTMAHNRSPYTVEIYGYSSAGNTLVIVMEYMSLGDLYGILHKKRHPLSKLQRMRMARHVAYGVAFLHSHHVMHRDIKSMNVLVTEDYACKLTDFGTAKIVQSNALFNTINAGTPMWMAPEVKMSNNYSFSADVYSLGLVLFELFENRLPEWNAARQCIMMPPTYESMSFVSPCINPQPRARPTADEVCKVLDKMIRNVVVGVKKNLPDNDQFKASGDSEDEIQALYRDLVKRPPQEVDGLILKSFPQSTSLPSAPNNQIPTGMPMGVPPMGMAQGFPMGPQGVPLGVSQGFPQGMPMGMPGVPMGMPPQQPYGYPQIPTTFPPGYPPGY